MKSAIFSIIFLATVLASTVDVEINSQGEESATCVDDEPNCPQLAARDGCALNFAYMQQHCARSCLLCDNHKGEVVQNIYSVEPQEASGESREETLKIIQATDVYMAGVFQNATLKKLWTTCRNRNSLCSYWAFLGECEKNPKYMALECAPACMSCPLLDFQNRCPLPDDMARDDIWKSDDLDKSFQHIISHSKDKYSVKIHSGPADLVADPNVPDGPWVVVLDDFLSHEECDILIEAGRVQGYKRSTDVGARKFDGTHDGKKSDTRTSSNAWCVDDCFANATVQDIHARMQDLTLIPTNNSEYLQLLEYQVGQFYGEHHDFVPFHLERYQGPRLMTVFLYLNDVEDGGGTNFPKLDLTVVPKRGRVVIWPSVRNDDPNKKDPRTNHQALPVIKGVKYGANAWIHLRDFKTPYQNGCS